MNKAEKFDESLQELSRFAKVISHPARLAILKYLTETKSCISGDISDYLKELRDIGLIHGEIDGLKINYCLCSNEIGRYLEIFENFFEPVRKAKITC
jgi:ArsR family transcriptional regulator